MPACALALGVDVAQHVGGERAAGVDALADLLAEDPLDVLRLDLAPLLRGDALDDVDELVGACEPGLQPGGVHLEQGRQRGGRGGGVLDEVLVGGDVARLDRHAPSTAPVES